MSKISLRIRESSRDFSSDFNEDSTAVLNQEEVVKMPVAEDMQTEIVTKFYDYNADSEDQEKALILHQNRYYQSDGISISTKDQAAFDVFASLSGTVSEVKQDPLLGNVVKLEHAQEVSTYYASLGEVFVEAGTEIKQGDTIGTAGQNLFGVDNGVHVHFELRKDGAPLNPEEFFNQPLNKVKAPKAEGLEDEEKEEDNAENEVDADTETGTDGDADTDIEEEDDSVNDEDQENSEDDADSEAEEENESSAAMTNT